MSKMILPDEIQVLRFFETGPIEKVEVVFNIITDKMRERLKDRQHASADLAPEKPSISKRRSATAPAATLNQREPAEPAMQV